jgi:hypothetical protein
MELLMTIITILLLGTWVAVCGALGLLILARLTNLVVKEFLN